MQVFPAPSNDVAPGVDRGLTNLVQRLAAKRSLHHVSLAVSDWNGDERWAATATSVGDEGYDPARPFFIASITKQFVVALLLQACERGEVRLDAPIAEYLPGSVVEGLHVWKGTDHSGRITVRHLATHTSGLPDFLEKRSGGKSLFEQVRAGRDVSWTFDEAIGIVKSEQRPYFPPQDFAGGKQKARYTDTGFVLLIRILEVVSGKGFSELIEDGITGPLGLQSTWLPEAAPSGGAAPMPLFAKRERIEVPGGIASSRDLISNLKDLLRFECSLTGGELFRHLATAALLTERTNLLGNAFGVRYGTGTMVAGVSRIVLPRVGPVTLVGHSGSTGSWLFSCPELRVRLAGTVDQAVAQLLPFRIMARCLQAWTRREK